MRALKILFLTLLSIAQAESAETTGPRVTIDIHAQPSDIRQVLLKYTPIGSSIECVMDFISKQLALPAAVSATTAQPANNTPQHRVAKTIDVHLGDYYKHLGAVFLTAPMIVHEHVSAQWSFDRQNRLSDIAVHKQARVY